MVYFFDAATTLGDVYFVVCLFAWCPSLVTKLTFPKSQQITTASLTTEPEPEYATSHLLEKEKGLDSSSHVDVVVDLAGNVNGNDITVVASSTTTSTAAATTATATFPQSVVVEKNQSSPSSSSVSSSLSLSVEEIVNNWRNRHKKFHAWIAMGISVPCVSGPVAGYLWLDLGTGNANYLFFQGLCLYFFLSVGLIEIAHALMVVKAVRQLQTND